ncbi:hypothetical protein JMJ35_004680 [Cladonia borealis]|uniref:Ubiquitin-related modifier 1 n=1 Tax=Cladonia borealis TaxID=184061 RepID=A0AA39R3H3_9LECA|nr:hypothetical protein JMJ35_004680 [Cladonia borealis]
MDTDSKSAQGLPIVVEFSGGLELLFSNQRKHKLSLPSRDGKGHATNMAYLVRYLCDNLMSDARQDMFVVDDTVRPGVLVLINDADWELEGEHQYELKKNDNVLFVSTLHGG